MAKTDRTSFAPPNIPTQVISAQGLADKMSDQADLLRKLRAALETGGVGTPSQTARPSRYDPPPRDESTQKEVDTLKQENRHLKRDNSDLKRQLDSIEAKHQNQLRSNHELLSGATDALIKATTDVESLKMEIRSQAGALTEERKLRQAAEVTMHSSKTQQSHLAKEKNDLEQKVRRLEGAEETMRQMSTTIKTLELSNTSLRQQIARGAGTQFQRGQLESLQDKCKAAEDAKHKAQDQLRHVRLQMDGLRIQVENASGKVGGVSLSTTRRPSTIPSRSQGQGQGQGHGRGQSRGPGHSQSLVSSSAKPVLQLSKGTPKSTFEQILTFVMDNISYIFEHLPPFIKSLIGIYRSFSTCSSESNSKATTSTPTSISTEVGKDKGVKNESKADGEQEEQVTQLMAEKGIYKKALREKEEELLKLKDKFEDQREQDRAYIEQFKAQERESQRYKSKRREKAYLKAIPILPPTPAHVTSTPPQLQPHAQARPEILAPTPQLPRPSEREPDFQLFSAGSSATDFTEDLQALADLTGRPLIDRKAERRDILAKESERDQSRLAFSLGFDDHHSTNLPSPKMKISPGGSMEDLEKQIRGMTTNKPDPYGDIDKAFSSFDNPGNDPPRRSMVATVEDEPDHETPVKANSTARTSPVSANEFMYGPDFA